VSSAAIRSGAQCLADDELRKDPLLAAGRWGSRMQHATVRLQVLVRIGEIKPVTRYAAMHDAEFGECGFACLVGVVQIQQESDHPLTQCFDLPGVVTGLCIDEIEMRRD